MSDHSKAGEKNRPNCIAYPLSITRKIVGKTQHDVSFETKIHQSRLSLFERGYAIPKQKEKEAIASALGMRVSDIDWR